MTLAVAGWSQATLDVEPRFVSLGSFSAQNPADDALNPGTTTLRITSPVPWSVYVTLVQPARRLSDNVELPVERVRQLFPDMAQLCSYVPVLLDHGSGGNEAQTLSFDWQLAQTRIAQFLEEADPPGTYRFSVKFDVRNPDVPGTPPGIVVTTEFVILPVVEIDLITPNWALEVDQPGEPAESDPYFVRVRSNCAWALEAMWGGDLIQVGGQGRIDHSLASWSVGGGDEWQSLIPSYTPVSLVSLLVARGSAPPPFSLAEAEIPFQLRVETAPNTLAGGYSTDARFAVHMDEESSR